jgi:hypothetical protein
LGFYSYAKKEKGMAAGLVQMSHGGGLASASYIMREKECEEIFTNMGNSVSAVKEKVKAYCELEKYGSKEMGIRACCGEPRHMTKLIVSLPNENSIEKNRYNLNRALEQTGIDQYPHIVAFHKGEKDGIINKHAHISFFERKFEPGNSKKDRYFNGKDFLDDFKRAYMREFGFSFNQEQRDRIPPKEYRKVQELKKENNVLTNEVKYLQNEREREEQYQYELPDDIFSKLNEEFERDIKQSGEPRQGYGGALQQAIEREREQQRAVQRAKDEADRKLEQAQRSAEELARQHRAEQERSRGRDESLSR